MIQKSLRNIVILIILASFITGSGGISILIHDCSGSKKRDYTAFPEYQRKGSNTCCISEKSGVTSKETRETALKKAACCKSSKITLKVNPYERIFTTQASALISPELPVYDLISADIEPDDTLIIACNSPPGPETHKPSGKELVFSIHQLRIPSAC